MAFVNGQVGQIKGINGPFPASIDNVLEGLTGKIGISIGEKDLMKIKASPKKDFKFKINNVEFIMGQTGIYEICEPGTVSISFPDGAPESVAINFISIDT